MKEFSYEEIDSATGSFALDHLVGKGSHGSVYKGRLTSGELVAVKKPLGNSLQSDSKLNNEINLLASVNHSGIVNLIGVAPSRPPVPSSKLLVMEYMPNGSLHDLLHSSPHPPTWPRRAAIALQVARAILALHAAAPAVVHRDVKSANILFDHKWTAKLADFSLAVLADGLGRLGSTAPAGTIGYLDPCYTESAKLGPANDVFSFGVVLLELASARKAVDVDREPSSIVAWALPLIRKGRVATVCDGRVATVCDGRVALTWYAEGAVRRMLRVAEMCVSEEVEGRPTMGEVAGELQGVVEAMMMWQALGGKLCERVQWCLRGWRRCTRKRVTTTRIVCKEHLVDDVDEERDGGGRGGGGDGARSQIELDATL